MLASSLPPRPAPQSIHPDHLPTQLLGCPPILALVLDRHGVCPRQDFPQYSHRTHDHHPEFRSAQERAGWIVHESYRRLDGHVSGLRVRRVHRVLGRQHAGPQRETEASEDEASETDLRLRQALGHVPMPCLCQPGNIREKRRRR